MKKVLAFILVLIGLFLAKSDYCEFVNLTDFPKDSQYCLYVGDTPSTENCVNVGSGYIVFDDIENAQSLVKNSKKIYGQSVCFEGTTDNYFELLKDLRLKECFVENIENIKVFYGFSNKLKDFTVVNGEKVNIQVAYREGKITVGTPLILGSF